MKQTVTLISSLVVCTLAFGILADTGSDAHERMLKASGGMITKPGSRTGTVLVLNSQSSASYFALTNEAAALAKLMRINVYVVSDKMSYADAMAKHQAKACVMLTENAASSRRLEYYPDENVAVVNVAALKADNPKPAFVDARTRKELARAFCYACGAGASHVPEALMGNKSTLKELDDMIDAKYPMDVISRMRVYLNSLGITPEIKVPYIRACREGWAPAPTNEYQKAVWDRARSDKERGPVAGLQIKP